MEYYRIGEFAKRCGTTVEFLKFYDREGLISPVWRDDAGYRYYADYQMVHFAELYKLSCLGFSVKQAKHFLDSSSLEELEISLLQRREGLVGEIAKQHAALSYLDGLLSAAKNVRSQNNWYIEPMDEFYFCVQVKATSESLPDTWWKTNLDLPEIWQRVELDSAKTLPLAGEPDTCTWGTLVLSREQLERNNFQEVTPIPGSRCFTYWYSVPANYDDDGRLSDCVWDPEKPLSIMAEHNLTPRGDLFQRRILVTHEKDGPFVHLMAIIPLK